LDFFKESLFFRNSRCVCPDFAVKVAAVYDACEDRGVLQKERISQKIS